MLDEYKTADKITDIYYALFSNNRVDLDRLTISTTEQTIYYNGLEPLINDMLDDIIKCLYKENQTNV